MRLKNRLKRIADILEKIGVASLAVGLFQNNDSGLYIAVICLTLSLIFTKEE